MLRRRGQWRAPLCLGRPRCIRVDRGRTVVAAPLPHLTSSTEAADGTHKGKEIPHVFSSTLTTLLAPTRPTTTLLAAFSGDVLQARGNTRGAPPQSTWPDEGPTSYPHTGVLRRALAGRDAYHIFCALLQQDQHHHFTSLLTGKKSELDELLLCDTVEETESVAALLCACVAVTLRPADWPTWVAARFSPTGAASLPVEPAAAAAADLAACSPTPASPLHTLAAHMLCRITGRLPRRAACATSPLLPLLRWLAQLCGVCLAPSSAAALRLAQEVAKTSLDAAGVALRAYCAANMVTDANHDRPLPPQIASPEERWLALWAELTQPSAVPPTLPPFVLSVAVDSGRAPGWTVGITPARLRETRVSWHLHCLLAVKEAHHAARLLAGTYQDSGSTNCEGANGGHRDSMLADSASVKRPSLPIAHATQAELLSSLPLQLLDENRLGEQLSFSLLSRVASGVVSDARSGLPLRPWSFVPAVSTHSVVYARMLRFILASTVQAQRESSYVQHLHDLALLLSSANVHSLAASFVPGDQPLTVVMVAAKDSYREEHVELVVSAVRSVVEVLCEEPTPFTTPSSVLPPQRTTPVAESSLCSSRSVPAGKRRRTKQATARPLSVSDAPDTLGAFSWKWREAVMGDVDGAVQAAVRLLTSLLELCSSRSTSLPLRKSEPKWRRELRERTAVRAHKFELLQQELPHSEIRAVLHTLLGHGYHREGSQLGVSLLRGDQVDLRFYTLPLLGSLYLAVSSALPAAVTTSSTQLSPTQLDDSESSRSSASDRWKEAVYKMYRRRFEIYGDADLNVTSPSYTTPQIRAGDGKETARSGACDAGASSTSASSSASAVSAPMPSATALVRTPENELVAALVLASTASSSTALENGTVELANCLLNRRAAVAGRGVVVDVGLPHRGMAFGSWLRKGTVTR